MIFFLCEVNTMHQIATMNFFEKGPVFTFWSSVIPSPMTAKMLRSSIRLARVSSVFEKMLADFRQKPPEQKETNWKTWKNTVTYYFSKFILPNLRGFGSLWATKSQGFFASEFQYSWQSPIGRHLPLPDHHGPHLWCCRSFCFLMASFLILPWEKKNS